MNIVADNEDAYLNTEMALRDQCDDDGNCEDIGYGDNDEFDDEE